MSVIRAAATAAIPTAQKVGQAVRNVFSAKPPGGRATVVRSNGQRAAGAAGAAVITGAVTTGFLVGTSEVTIQTAEEVTQKPIGKSSKEFKKTQLDILKFPLDLEEEPVPHMLIKIYETETGPVQSSDLTTQSFYSGVGAAANVAGVVGGAGGALLGAKAALSPAALLALGKNYAAAAAAVGIGAAAGGAIGANAGDIAEGVTNKLGELVGAGDVGSRAKQLMANFALKRNIEQLSVAVALLMPETLAVSYQNNYDALSFSQAAGGIGMVAQALGTKNGQGGDLNPYIIEGAGRLAGSILSEEFQRIGLFATTGRTLNPQPEVIYNSPGLREFTMDFRLVPRNQVEARLINVIIDTLKYYASPQIPKETGGRYFIPPAQFELEFYDSENNQNTFLFKTKKCVLEDIAIDFTGTGSYTSFYDGSPVETRLSLKFKETVFIDRDAVNQGY